MEEADFIGSFSNIIARRDKTVYSVDIVTLLQDSPSNTALLQKELMKNPRKSASREVFLFPAPKNSENL